MNLHNLRRLRDHLAGLKEHGNEHRFNMADFLGCPGEEPASNPDNECGTAACLAGWATMIGMDEAGFCVRTVERLESDLEWVGMDVESYAMEWLDLTTSEASRLFYGDWSPHCPHLSLITIDEAIEHLDEILAGRRTVDYVHPVRTKEGECGGGS